MQMSPIGYATTHSIRKPLKKKNNKKLKMQFGSLGEFMQLNTKRVVFQQANRGR